MTETAPGVVTRGEFDLLKQMVSDQAARLTAIDDHGTRGVVVLQAQLAELISDMAEMKTEFRTEQKLRISGRRWVLGMAVTGTAAIAGLVSALVTVLSAVHH